MLQHVCTSVAPAQTASALTAMTGWPTTALSQRVATPWTTVSVKARGQDTSPLPRQAKSGAL